MLPISLLKHQPSQSFQSLERESVEVQSLRKQIIPKSSNFTVKVQSALLTFGMITSSFFLFGCGETENTLATANAQLTQSNKYLQTNGITLPISTVNSTPFLTPTSLPIPSNESSSQSRKSTEILKIINKSERSVSVSANILTLSEFVKTDDQILPLAQAIQLCSLSPSQSLIPSDTHSFATQFGEYLSKSDTLPSVDGSFSKYQTQILYPVSDSTSASLDAYYKNDPEGIVIGSVEAGYLKLVHMAQVYLQENNVTSDQFKQFLQKQLNYSNFIVKTSDIKLNDLLDGKFIDTILDIAKEYKDSKKGANADTKVLSRDSDLAKTYALLALANFQDPNLIEKNKLIIEAYIKFPTTTGIILNGVVSYIRLGEQLHQVFTNLINK